ncbi:hypothetical protein MMC25_005595 [Agyrium rufum]|nr:hypothetical protein [Agyrium rufum]
MAVPQKFRAMGDFHEYYSGTRKAKYLTIFIGGNHEASNHLLELFYGGWVAPNIYYMGAAGVVRLGSLRIAGLSGIWKGYDYRKPHHERIPYSDDDVRSCYHIREFDVKRLLHIRSQIDIGLSHDWPKGIEWFGNHTALFREKPFFEEEARSGTLGSPVTRDLLNRLRPAYWFSAHLHCKFAAVLQHESSETRVVNGVGSRQSESKIKVVDALGSNGDTAGNTSVNEGPNSNSEEIAIEDDTPDGAAKEESGSIKTHAEIGSDGTAESIPKDIRDELPEAFRRPIPSRGPPPLPPTESINNQTTRFLALGKCLSNREFLQLVDIETMTPLEETSPPRLAYDPEWLAITRSFAPFLCVGGDANTAKDRTAAEILKSLQDEGKWVESNVVAKDLLIIHENFVLTAPLYDPVVGINTPVKPREYSNPQTKAFCELLQIPNPFDISEDERDRRMLSGSNNANRASGNHPRGRGQG